LLGEKKKRGNLKVFIVYKGEPQTIILLPEERKGKISQRVGHRREEQVLFDNGQKRGRKRSLSKPDPARKSEQK